MFAGVDDGPDFSPRTLFVLGFFIFLALHAGLLLAPTAAKSGQRLLCSVSGLALLPPFAFSCLSLWPCINPASYTCRSHFFQATVVISSAVYAWALARVARSAIAGPKPVV